MRYKSSPHDAYGPNTVSELFNAPTRASDPTNLDLRTRRAGRDRRGGEREGRFARVCRLHSQYLPALPRLMNTIRSFRAASHFSYASLAGNCRPRPRSATAQIKMTGIPKQTEKSFTKKILRLVIACDGPRETGKDPAEYLGTFTSEVRKFTMMRCDQRSDDEFA
ncbi:hypothetical protein EVAR_51845_1 [Eumeta japonica]|uniref:Uncharacterized protein n=1 Tax=Eumeta variegata TaxID=151549 RepID=A0A4C1YMX5_EUMVA|nr:hypothetical protein EVAR_51845_1 [Eumeta japonica]